MLAEVARLPLRQRLSLMLGLAAAAAIVVGLVFGALAIGLVQRSP